MKASKKMEEIFDLSVKEIRGVLNGSHNATDASRMAMGTLGVYSRLRSTEVHEEALKFQIARETTEDRKQLKASLKALPE